MSLRLFTRCLIKRPNVRFCSTQDRNKILPDYIPNLENQFVKLLKKSGNTKITVEKELDSIKITYEVAKPPEINPEIKEQVEVTNSIIEKIDIVIITAGIIAGFILFILAFAFVLYHIGEFIENYPRLSIGTCIALVITAAIRMAILS